MQIALDEQTLMAFVADAWRAQAMAETLAGLCGPDAAGTRQRHALEAVARLAGQAADGLFDALDAAMRKAA